MLGALERSVLYRLSAAWKPGIRAWRSRARTWYLRRRYPFAPSDLLRALRNCGVSETDALLVHSSYADFAGFRGSASDVVRVLEAAVLPHGLLLMPTLSFSGSAVVYARKNPVFDPARTPSHVGLFTEVFRRQKNVKRSLHPTHSVAGLGTDVDALLADHHRAGTPCGRGTPYHRLIERDGKVVLLNTGFGAFTLYHCIEELIEPLLPFSPFTEERYTLRIRNGEHALESAPMRLFDPAVSRRRNLDALRRRLRQTGKWREGRVGNVGIIVLSARDALVAAEELAREGIYCYDRETPCQLR